MIWKVYPAHTILYSFTDIDEANKYFEGVAVETNSGATILQKN